jgi:NAD(P)-dependent dehydrogenase (short-subunit alcohol dehydrogenase family)
VSFDPATAFRLDGKVALVTGGTRGIGRAIAEAFVKAGASVAVMARKPDELDETAQALRSCVARMETAPRVTMFAGSAGDPAAIEAAVAHCVEELGALDVLVNNAGTNPVFGPMIEVEEVAVRKVLEVNIEGPLWLAQAAWRSWMRDHGGVVINVASVGGIRPSPGIGIYNLSKAALIHLTKQLAMELGPTVRVNALVPGLVKTRFSRALYEADEEGAAVRHPMKRLGVPDDIAGAALFLASDAASWLTGEAIVIDGGALLA